MTFFLRLLWRFRMPSGASTPHVKSGIIPQLNMGRGVKQGAASPHLSKRGGCGPQAAGGASAEPISPSSECLEAPVLTIQPQKHCNAGKSPLPLNLQFPRSYLPFKDSGIKD